MRVVAKEVELLRDSAERPRIGGEIPERLLERPVAKISAEQQEVVPDRHPLPGPRGDQTGGKGMAEIMNARPVARAGRDEIHRQRTEHTMHGSLAERPSCASQEEPIGECGMAVSFHDVAAQHRRGRRMQR